MLNVNLGKDVSRLDRFVADLERFLDEYGLGDLHIITEGREHVYFTIDRIDDENHPICTAVFYKDFRGQVTDEDQVHDSTEYLTWDETAHEVISFIILDAEGLIQHVTGKVMPGVAKLRLIKPPRARKRNRKRVTK